MQAESLRVVPAAGREAYEAALTRLCERVGIPAAEHESVLANEGIVMGGVPIAFQHEAWSNFIKVFIEVGKPSEADAPAFYRWVLAQHLAMPSPFSMVAGLHPSTDQVVLYGASPMPESPEADEGFMGFVAGCVHVCGLLRQPEGIRLDVAPAA